VEAALEYVRAGWATDLNALLTDALRRYLDSHAAGLAERFLREDVEWGLHGSFGTAQTVNALNAADRTPCCDRGPLPV
jgi:hypothetical protein